MIAFPLNKIPTEASKSLYIHQRRPFAGIIHQPPTSLTRENRSDYQNQEIN